MGMKQILIDFSLWTSAHGIPHIGSAQNLCLRIFWAIIFLGSTAMFTFQLFLLVTKFLSFDVTVQTELKFEERYFPAVTVCSLNPFKNSKISHAPEIQNLMDNYTNAVMGTSLESDVWGFNELSENGTIAIQSKAKDLLVLVAAKLNQTNFEAINLTTYEKTDLIINCAYNTKPCEPTDFKKTIDPIYGSCYTFNNEEPPKYKSTRAGPLYGLRLLLKSNESEYLPTTESAGVRVSVHGQGEEPFPDAFGYNAAAGFTTSFGIKFIRTTRLPSPYGNCTDGIGSNTYFYKSAYSVEGCFRSCFQKHIKKQCGCYDPRFATDYKSRETVYYCAADKPKQVKCISDFSSYQSGQSNFNPISNCSCPQPCNESTYGVTVSTALWPSAQYEPSDCEGMDAETCRAWYAENTMLIEVYYERMNYQLLSESEAYGLVNLVSDMGGQLGLWMGISLITVVEFFSLMVLLCLYCLARRKEPTIDDEESDDDLEDLKEKKKPSESSPPPPYECDITDLTPPAPK